MPDVSTSNRVLIAPEAAGANVLAHRVPRRRILACSLVIAWLGIIGTSCRHETSLEAPDEVLRGTWGGDPIGGATRYAKLFAEYERSKAESAPFPCKAILTLLAEAARAEKCAIQEVKFVYRCYDEAISLESFMPVVVMAVKHLVKNKCIFYGLETNLG